MHTEITYFSRFVSAAHNVSKDCVGHIAPVYTKISDLARQHLYPQALLKHGTNWLTAKIWPAAPSASLIAKEAEVERRIRRLHSLKTATAKQLAQEAPLTPKRRQLEHNSQTFANSLQKANSQAHYLKAVRQKETIGRLAWHVGKIVQFVALWLGFPTQIEGSSLLGNVISQPPEFIANTLVTTAVLEARLKDSAQLTDPQFKKQQTAQTRQIILWTVATTVTSLALGCIVRLCMNNVSFDFLYSHPITPSKFTP